MTEQPDLDSRFARIEAALAATAEALEAAEARGVDGGADSDALREAQARIEVLEREAREREAALETSAAGDGTAARVDELESKLAALRAARSEDLIEMKSLLAELEPLLEGADA